MRRLERRCAQAPSLVEPAVKSLDAALTALEETRGHLEQALRAADFDPQELERIEERLFALRAAGRKYSVAVDDLAALAARYAADIALIDAGEERLKALEEAARAAEADYRAAADKLVQGAREGRVPRSTRRSTASSSRSSWSGRNSRPGSKAMPPRSARTASIASSSGCRPIRAHGRGR